MTTVFFHPNSGNKVEIEADLNEGKSAICLKVSVDGSDVYLFLNADQAAKMTDALVNARCALADASKGLR